MKSLIYIGLEMIFGLAVWLVLDAFAPILVVTLFLVLFGLAVTLPIWWRLTLDREKSVVNFAREIREIGSIWIALHGLFIGVAFIATLMNVLPIYVLLYFVFLGVILWTNWRVMLAFLYGCRLFPSKN